MPFYRVRNARSIAGFTNYYLAVFLGRKLILNTAIISFGAEKLEKVERFFKRTVHFQRLRGRLIPVVRHYISLPAGLARMWHFFAFTRDWVLVFG